MAGTVGPDEAVFRSHLPPGSFLLGAPASRWRQVLVAWPYALFACARWRHRVRCGSSVAIIRGGRRRRARGTSSATSARAPNAGRLHR